MTCQAYTKANLQCKNASKPGSKFCGVHQTKKATPKAKNQLTSKSSSANGTLITYPWASKFLEWLLPELKARKIPYRNPETDGDYYQPTIGKTKIMLDWKHLWGQIEDFSNAIKPYGYKITYVEVEDGYSVKIVKN